ncbi:MAG: xanthine dehydrogenase family protein subunit M [candidate division KSB1 bacterium]|nr:xanthine dehydrogenase family protein subunit M [candidate division KSB1 bacterium]MDZ7276190.1 xanthine dehydrogenase family protein subunit M [candidate division KSB1 bacterium]MDZ7287030.1 xanthine dehydrogenase family protein subunit M [candidate division KSB1 bacterium]MDZ7297045.1 xanthine dehydrogenase family protein subunit M [candidate division KSB1 bacterium]MDZ7307194.1 xanthine dehydrogenase family protein subunit M [candidate division KSB1 bacterium]
MIAAIKAWSPRTLAEAYQILTQEQGRIKVLAGGTDVMVALQARTECAPAYLNLWPLAELRGIAETQDAVRLGALTTYTQLMRSTLVQQQAPILVDAAGVIGARQIQNRGTLGGNIVNASPAGDTLPVLAVLEATLELGSARGTRLVPFNAFYTGYRQTVLAADELLLAVILPKRRPQERQYFRKVGTRQAQAISKVVMALLLQQTQPGRVDFIRIAFGSVAPTVMRAPRTEAVLQDQILSRDRIAAARAQVMAEVRPISDVRSTADYRRTVAGNILARALYDCEQGDQPAAPAAAFAGPGQSGVWR